MRRLTSNTQLLTIALGADMAGSQGQTQTQLGNVRLTKDFQKYRVSAGYANTSYFSSAPGRSLQYNFSGEGFMAAFSSSNHLLLDRSRGSLTPINRCPPWRPKAKADSPR